MLSQSLQRPTIQNRFIFILVLEVIWGVGLGRRCVVIRRFKNGLLGSGEAGDSPANIYTKIIPHIESKKTGWSGSVSISGERLRAPITVRRFHVRKSAPITVRRAYATVVV